MNASARTERRSGDAVFPTDGHRLQGLRSRATTDRSGASAAAWSWVSEFRDPSTHHRLHGLFAEGGVPDGPHGVCEGQVLGLYGAVWLDVVDRLVRAGQFLGGIGWTGKTFESSGHGFNRLTRSARLPMFAAMPRYDFRTSGGELVGFDFDHQIDSSPYGSGQRVCSIAYARPEYGNPLVMPNIRDELVEMVPGVYLGRVLRRKNGEYRRVGYFALRSRNAGEG